MTDLVPILNDTKWMEIRESMLSLEELSPVWRSCCTINGHISAWDGEWFCHFLDGGFKDIEWVEIRTDFAAQEKAVLRALKVIHVPGTATENGFKIYGYIKPGFAIDYL